MPDPSFVTTEPTRRGSPVWVEPYPDVLLPDYGAGPEARYEAKESIALAFVAAIQHLPPRQRAVLVLRDVLGFRAAEVAEPARGQRALGEQRAAARPGDHGEPAARAWTGTGRRSPGQRASGTWRPASLPPSPTDDIDGVVALLTDDAWFTMPPVTLEYQGPAAIGGVPRRRLRLARGRPYRLVPIGANGQPAYGLYICDGHAPVFRAYGTGRADPGGRPDLRLSPGLSTIA